MGSVELYFEPTLHGIIFQIELPEWSSLSTQNCVTLEETTEELYEEITDIKDELGNSELTGGCINFLSEDPKQKDVNKAFQEKICEISEQLTKVSSPMNGLFCPNLDYGDLIDPNDCDGEPSNWCEFAQFVLDILKRDQINEEV